MIKAQTLVYVRSVIKADGELLLIVLMASGRLGLMGVRPRERHGKGQTASWADIGHQYAKAHHLHQASKINNTTFTHSFSAYIHIRDIKKHKMYSKSSLKLPFHHL